MTYEELRQELTRESVIEGAARPTEAPRVVVGGMGGSALPAYAVRFLDPAVPIAAHHGYDLPEGALADTLYVAISYSGNTEETLSFAKAVRDNNYPLAVIASGGALAEFAREHALPFVQVPSGIQPRNALFYLLRGLLALLNRADLLEALAAVTFDEAAAQQEADALASAVADALPIFYSSRSNGFLAHAFKINMNETAKLPSFCNVFPELNHNEMQSFDTFAPEAVGALARFALLSDARDDARIARRMQVFAELMRARGRSVTEVALLGESRAEQLVRGWFVAHRSAHALAAARGVDPDAVPLVEDFKKKL